MKSQTEKLNDDSYIPYNRPSDAADKHLDVNSFQKEAANATLDLASKGQTGKKEKPRQVKISQIKWGAYSRYSSSLYCSMRYSDQMTIEKMHPTLIYARLR